MACVQHASATPVSTPSSPRTPRKVKCIAKRNKKSRNRSPNYSEADIEALLDIVYELEPTERNDRTAVAAKFGDYRTVDHCPKKDVESVKMKLDFLESVKSLQVICRAHKMFAEPNISLALS